MKTAPIVNGNARVSDPPDKKFRWVQCVMVLDKVLADRFEKVQEMFDHEPERFMRYLLDLHDASQKRAGEEIEKRRKAWNEVARGISPERGK